MTIVPDQQPATLRLELGKGLDRDPFSEGLVQCSFSAVVTDARLLTPDDVAELGISTALIGTGAEITTSIHGVAWISLLRP